MANCSRPLIITGQCWRQVLDAFANRDSNHVVNYHRHEVRYVAVGASTNDITRHFPGGDEPWRELRDLTIYRRGANVWIAEPAEVMAGG